MVFPTYLLILPFKLADQEVIEFYGQNASNTIPGAPDLALRYAVDGQRDLTIHKPLPTASTGSKFQLRNKVIGIYDKGSAGSSFDTEQKIVDTVTGEVYTTTRSVSFVPKQGNWGGPRGPTMPLYHFPSRAPDATYEVQTTDNTVFLYRLNGDYNPPHAVPYPGLKMGLGGVIIHGLFTYSSTCYGIVSKIFAGDAGRLKFFGARFAFTVRPGDKLTTTMVDGYG
ncbi:MaoC-like dehydratase [Penicillium expansum]|uniref:MaoC-like dehydratase n=1 Tax=Penicillium expansum TaxID=27334 RepID=A0A0A2I716_PENEN|nr:MaoC-like dehydratase [Penicillium expansum]KGO38869.1 MaoC-like dehydratase [Penicillium expansum]KGO59165.1 MaoC-like dehydratase [Penicillium expansum]KGO61045.1 MaoC-like dehydratase [Penicillium expansum]